MFTNLNRERVASSLGGVQQDDVGRLYREIGRNIQVARVGHVPKLSQRELAGKIGLSRASVVNIEKGRHRVQIHVLYDLARALDAQLAELLPQPTSSIILPASFASQLRPKELELVEQMITTRAQSHARTDRNPRR